MATRVVLSRERKLKIVSSVLAEILREAHGKTLSPRELSIVDRFNDVGITNSTQIPSETIRVFKDKKLVRVIENEDGTKYRFDSESFPDFENLASEIIDKVAQKKREMYERSKEAITKTVKRQYKKRDSIPPSYSKLEKAHKLLSGSSQTNTKTLTKGERFSIGESCYLMTDTGVVREGKICLIEALDPDFREIVYGVRVSSTEDPITISTERVFHNIDDLARSLTRTVIRYR